jgi:hypothetical protein
MFIYKYVNVYDVTCVGLLVKVLSRPLRTPAIYRFQI